MAISNFTTAICGRLNSLDEYETKSGRVDLAFASTHSEIIRDLVYLEVKNSFREKSVNIVCSRHTRGNWVELEVLGVDTSHRLSWLPIVNLSYYQACCHRVQQNPCKRIEHEAMSTIIFQNRTV